jgi:hypothetical protein
MVKLEFKCIEKITREHIFNDTNDPVVQVRFGVSEQEPFGTHTPGVEFSAWMIKTVADKYEVGRYYTFTSELKAGP